MEGNYFTTPLGRYNKKKANKNKNLIKPGK
jgi:hypothetical protein